MKKKIAMLLGFTMMLGLALTGCGSKETGSDTMVYAVEAGSAGEAVAQEKGFEMNSVASQADALMEVASGTSDAAIIDLLMAGAMIGEGTSYPNLTYTDKLTTEEYGVGCRKGSDLAAYINVVFADTYADGSLKETAIDEKYGVQESLVEQTACEYTASADSDVAYIQGKGTLIVGITDFEPMDYKDASGNWIGFDADMARVVAKKLGVDTENLLISQPDNGEQSLEIVETLVRSNAVDVIVVDSVAALVPQAEIDGDMGDSHMGLQARLMSQALRKLTGIINKSKATVIFINQIRMKIGVMFGNPETTTGGNALKFYASVRVDIRRIGQIKVGDDILGNRTKVKVVKNKIAPPFRVAEFDIMYNEGISRTGDVLDLAVEYGIVNKAGAWFSYGEDKVGQGRDASKQFLKDNPKLLAEIEKQVRQKAAEAEKE